MKEMQKNRRFSLAASLENRLLGVSVAMVAHDLLHEVSTRARTDRNVCMANEIGIVIDFWSGRREMSQSIERQTKEIRWLCWILREWKPHTNTRTQHEYEYAGSTVESQRN